MFCPRVLQGVLESELLPPPVGGASRLRAAPPARAGTAPPGASAPPGAACPGDRARVETRNRARGDAIGGCFRTRPVRPVSRASHVLPVKASKP